MYIEFETERLYVPSCEIAPADETTRLRLGDQGNESAPRFNAIEQ